MINIIGNHCRTRQRSACFMHHCSNLMTDLFRYLYFKAAKLSMEKCETEERLDDAIEVRTKRALVVSKPFHEASGSSSNSFHSL